MSDSFARLREPAERGDGGRDERALQVRWRWAGRRRSGRAVNQGDTIPNTSVSRCGQGMPGFSARASVASRVSMKGSAPSAGPVRSWPCSDSRGASCSGLAGYRASPPTRSSIGATFTSTSSRRIPCADTLDAATLPPKRAVLPTPVGHQVEIGAVGLVLEEGLLVPVPALGHMVRIVWCQHSCNACYDRRGPAPTPACQLKSVWCPRIAGMDIPCVSA